MCGQGRRDIFRRKRRAVVKDARRHLEVPDCGAIARRPVRRQTRMKRAGRSKVGQRFTDSIVQDT